SAPSPAAGKLPHPPSGRDYAPWRRPLLKLRDGGRRPEFSGRRKTSCAPAGPDEKNVMAATQRKMACRITRSKSMSQAYPPDAEGRDNTLSRNPTVAAWDSGWRRDDFCFLGWHNSIL